jgi:hypothetical protein
VDGGVVVVAAPAGAVKGAGVDGDSGSTGANVAGTDATVDPSPPTAAVIVPTVAGTMLGTDGAPLSAPETVPGSRVDAPEVTVLSSPWGRSDSAWAPNPANGALADPDVPESREPPEPVRL